MGGCRLAMATLSDVLWEAEAQIRAAIASKWRGLGADTGNVHARERYADTEKQNTDLIAIKDSLNQTVVRAAFVKWVRSTPLKESASSCLTPQQLTHHVEVLYGFEDKRKNGTNSSDGFNKLLMQAVAAFDQDRSLGLEGLEHNGLAVIEDAGVITQDDVLVHRTVLEINSDVYAT